MINDLHRRTDGLMIHSDPYDCRWRPSSSDAALLDVRQVPACSARRVYRVADQFKRMSTSTEWTAI
jgi:hypothetical protein